MWNTNFSADSCDEAVLLTQKKEIETSVKHRKTEVFVSKLKPVAADDKRVSLHREEIQKVVRPLVQEQERRQSLFRQPFRLPRCAYIV